MVTHRKRKTMVLRTEEQRRAFTSPFRMELIGLFLDREPLSVAQMAQRMGRSATSLHYHVGVLEKAGLLKRVGTQRAGRRSEGLYLPAADLFKVEQEREDVAAAKDALKTLSTAFRMAESDLRAALHDPRSKSGGPYRNLYGARVHCRMSKKDLAELNRHLRAIEKMLSQVQRKHEPSTDDQFVSLTLALMPLRNREVLS
jgi:predicted transcriptional regulator